jgi:hypothetical protein
MITKKSSQKKQLNPVQLRGLLVASLLLLFAAGAGLFAWSYTQLQTYGQEVATKNGQAVASNDSLSSLQATKRFLDENTTLLDQAQLFTLKRDLPQFQIRNDITRYASLRGLSLSSVELDSSGGATAPSTSGSGTSSPTTPAPAATPAAGNQLGVTVAFKDKVDYISFLKFLYDIEHNLPKMTVEKVVLAEGSSDGRVKVDPILIKTYIN